VWSATNERGRGKLPAWVVKIRSVLRCMTASSENNAEVRMVNDEQKTHYSSFLVWDEQWVVAGHL
jgi:hypothetical protein